MPVEAEGADAGVDVDAGAAEELPEPAQAARESAIAPANSMLMTRFILFLLLEIGSVLGGRSAFAALLQHKKSSKKTI